MTPHGRARGGAQPWLRGAPIRLSQQGDVAIPRSENRIRQIRAERGLSLEELAQRVGTSNQQISHLELGKRQLTVDWLRRLGAALGCHPWALVEEPSDTTGPPL